MKGVDAQKNAALRAGEPAASVNAEASAKPAEAETIAAEAQAEAAPAEDSQATVRALLKTGVISNSEANRVLADAGLRTEFERQTGETLTGTKADQRAQIKRVALTQNITGEPAKSEARAKSTAIDTSQEQHTPEQQANIQEYQNSVDNRVLTFIHKWNGLKNADYKKRARVQLDTVSERAVSDLKSTVGIDATGYRHSIDGNALRILKNATERTARPITPWRTKTILRVSAMCWATTTRCGQFSIRMGSKNTAPYFAMRTEALPQLSCTQRESTGHTTQRKPFRTPPRTSCALCPHISQKIKTETKAEC